MDGSTAMIDLSQFAGLMASGSDDDLVEDLIHVDPDRPPLSKTDRRKLKNQLKSKAKKTPEEIKRLRE